MTDEEKDKARREAWKAYQAVAAPAREEYEAVAAPALDVLKARLREIEEAV
jgi:hypothetical protein